MTCPGSISLEASRVDKSSEFADWGTVAHDLASIVLKAEESAADDVFAAHAGKYGVVVGKGAVEYRDAAPGHLVDDDMVSCVRGYAAHIREYAIGAELFVEQRLSFSKYVGVPNQFGTSDAVILKPLDGTNYELHVADLKTGKGVKVFAEQNEQLMLYALAAYQHNRMLYDITHVRLTIHQPRLGHLSEWSCTVDELLEFASRARDAVTKCIAAGTTEGDDFLAMLNPDPDACRFCKAKDDCPALQQQILHDVFGDYDDLDTAKPRTVEHAEVAALLPKLDMIEKWCNSVRARAYEDLENGVPVPGWKLVTGKGGNRTWSDDEKAEEAMRSMHLKRDEMYVSKVISPSQAEKLLSTSKRRWNRLQALITRSEGKPTLAPESDPRPALVRAGADFDSLDEAIDTAVPADLSDLF